MEQQERGTGLGERVLRGAQPLPLALVALSVLEPFLGFLDRNRTEYLQVGILVQLALGSLVLSLVGYAILLVAFPRVPPVRLAASLAVFAFCFFRYSALAGETTYGPVVTLGFWALLTAVAVAVTALWSRHAGVCWFLLIFLGALTVQPAISYVSYQLGKEPVAEASDDAREPIPVTGEAERTPDVWWLLFDEYGRADNLEALLDFDNTPFLDDLEERGFEVAEESYTSYPNTALSISSVLEMEYIAATPDDVRDGAYAVTEPMRGDSRVVDALGEYGYEYLYADNGVFDWTQCDDAVVDVCIDAPRTGPDLGHLTQTVADLTPFAELRSEARPDPEWTVRRAQEQMETDEPEFVFAHVLNPHEPYWFEDDCEYRSSPIHSNFDPVRYEHQLGCLNPRILDAVDAILEDDPDAMIVLQSDHGTGVLTHWTIPLEEWTPQALYDRYSIFEAARLPDECETPEGPHTNVFTFEYVLACIEGRAPEVPDERYFFWRNRAPTEIIEIDRPAAPDG